VPPFSIDCQVRRRSHPLHTKNAAFTVDEKGRPSVPESGWTFRPRSHEPTGLAANSWHVAGGRSRPRRIASFAVLQCGQSAGFGWLVSLLRPQLQTVCSFSPSTCAAQELESGISQVLRSRGNLARPRLISPRTALVPSVRAPGFPEHRTPPRRTETMIVMHRPITPATGDRH